MATVEEKQNMNRTTTQYCINRNSFGNHYDVESIEGEALYYAEQMRLSSQKPDLRLHRGGDKSGPIVAVSHMPYLSTSFKVGIGDPDGSGSMLWEEVRKPGFSSRGNRWAADVVMERNETKRMNLNWKTTASVGADGMTVPWSSSRNFKLVNDDTNEVIAIFTSDRSYKKCGVLQINVDYGESFEVMIIITCMTVYENAKREPRVVPQASDRRVLSFF